MGNNRRNNNGNFGKQLFVWLAIILAFSLMFGMNNLQETGKTQKLSYDEFVHLVEEQPPHIKSVKLDKGDGEITGVFHSTGRSADQPANFTVQGQPPSTFNLEFTKWLTDHGVKVAFTPSGGIWETLLYMFVPTLLLILFLYFIIGRSFRGGGMNPFSFGKMRVNMLDKGASKKTFADVAGVDEAREEVKEIVDFLRNPERAERLGGRLPRGVLLIGPPGTGKTLLAKAIAGEAGVPFFCISGSDFIEMFVGVGASRVRDLFGQAKENSPCIIFLDEIDAVGRKRMNDAPGGGLEAAQTLNAILVEMDGFTSDDKIIVIAATNRADVLDPALLRPGRFDRRINVDLPDVKGREEILKVHIRNVKVSPEVELSTIARGTPTFSGAELENVVNEAALIAAFSERNAVDQACFEEARDKVRWGKEKKSRVMSDNDRRDTAYHEAGHALLMKYLPNVTPFHKVSIIPRGRALGLTMQLPEKDEYSSTQKKLLGEIIVFFGGRAAEELFLHDISTGASNDIERATRYARAMVCEWGMTDELGIVNYNIKSNEEGYSFQREFSEATAEMIDRKVRAITEECYHKAKNLLNEHKEDVGLVVEALMEFEVLDRDGFNLLLETRSLDALRDYRQTHAPASETAGEEVVILEEADDEAENGGGIKLAKDDKAKEKKSEI
ncbi:ATP-dependent zinc metalloprotease FtsH [Planctomycetales bacterium]|nr:ATP-dependent zinc metalloprotease FtsH [Planctomycetales bacterium]